MVLRLIKLHIIMRYLSMFIWRTQTEWPKLQIIVGGGVPSRLKRQAVVIKIVKKGGVVGRPETEIRYIFRWSIDLRFVTFFGPVLLLRGHDTSSIWSYTSTCVWCLAWKVSCRHAFYPIVYTCFCSKLFIWKSILFPCNGNMRGLLPQFWSKTKVQDMK